MIYSKELQTNLNSIKNKTIMQIVDLNMNNLNFLIRRPGLNKQRMKMRLNA